VTFYFFSGISIKVSGVDAGFVARVIRVSSEGVKKFLKVTFLSETWARALRVLRWKSSRIQVLCETECSASRSHVGVVAKREKF